MLKTQTFLNQLYHAKEGTVLDGVDLATPLSYADRFRIRHPGGEWGFHPPHVDGQSLLIYWSWIYRQSYTRWCYRAMGRQGFQTKLRFHPIWRLEEPRSLRTDWKTRRKDFLIPTAQSIFGV